MDIAEFARFADPTGKCADPRMINAVAAYCGVTLASDAEIEEGQRLAASRIEGAVAADMMKAVQAITHSSIFIVREQGRVTGLTAFFPVRSEGMRAFAEGRFDTVSINLDYVCRPRETPAGAYGWGFVGSNDRAAGRAVKAVLAVRETLWWALEAYTKAATDDGVRVIVGSLGFKPVEGMKYLARYEPRSGPFQGLVTKSRAA